MMDIELRIKLEEIQNRIYAGADKEDCGLLCMIDLPEEDVEFIRDHAKTIVLRYLDTGEFSGLTAYVLMLSSLKNYEDGAYWEAFWDVVGIDRRSIRNTESLCECFRMFCNTHGLYYSTRSFKKNVINFSMHALIPDSYSDRFFDCIDKFYALKLKNNLSDDVDEDICRFLCYLSEADALQFQSSFIKGTKEAFANPKCCLSFMKKLLRRMDGSGDSEEDNLGIHEGTYIRWSRGIKKNRHSVKPYMSYLGGTLKLVVPERTVKHAEDACITLRINGRKAAALDSDPYQVVDVFFTSERSFRLSDYTDDPFAEISVEMGSKQVYHAHQRNYIVFASTGREIHSVSRGYNTILVRPDIQFDFRNSSILDSKPRYVVRSAYVRPGDVLKIGGVSLGIERAVDEILSFNDESMPIYCETEDGTKIDAYSELPKMILHVPNRKFDTMEVKFDFGFKPEVHKVSDLAAKPCSKCMSLGDEKLITVDLKTLGIPEDRGLYSVQINYRKKVNFVLFPNCSVVSDSPFYGNNRKHGQLQILTEKGLENLDFDIEAQGKLDITEYLGVSVFRTMFEIPTVYCSLDGDTWKVAGDKVDIDSINGEIRVKGSVLDGCRYYLSCNPDTVWSAEYDDKKEEYILPMKNLKAFKLPYMHFNHFKVKLCHYNPSSGRLTQTTVCDVKVRKDYIVKPWSVLKNEDDGLETSAVEISGIAGEVPLKPYVSIPLEFTPKMSVSVFEMEDDGFGGMEHGDAVYTANYDLCISDMDEVFNPYCNQVNYRYEAERSEPLNPLQKDLFITAIELENNKLDMECIFNRLMYDRGISVPKKFAYEAYMHLWGQIASEYVRRNRISEKKLMDLMSRYNSSDYFRAYCIGKYLYKGEKDMPYKFMMSSLEKRVTEYLSRGM